MHYRLRAGAQSRYRQWIRDFRLAFGRNPTFEEKEEAMTCAKTKTLPSWFNDLKKKAA